MRNNIQETIKDITYKNGARVTTVEQVISRADDCVKLGELYFRMADHYRRLEQEITDEEREIIEKDLGEVKAQISVYLVYLAGYEE